LVDHLEVVVGVDREVLREVDQEVEDVAIHQEENLVEEVIQDLEVEADQENNK